MPTVMRSEGQEIQGARATPRVQVASAILYDGAGNVLFKRGLRHDADSDEQGVGQAGNGTPRMIEDQDGEHNWDFAQANRVQANQYFDRGEEAAEDDNFGTYRRQHANLVQAWRSCRS